MVDTTTFTDIYIDKILGEDGMQAIEHVDGWPAMGIRFRKGINESLYLSRLYEATKQYQFDVFTHETMPRRWHFSKNERIAPIYIVPKVDHVLTTVKEGNKTGNPGVSGFLLCNLSNRIFRQNHGFDNIETAMQAMFVAHGPFAAVVKTMHQSEQRRRSLTWADKGWHSTSNDTYVMSTFPNVEIYGLIMKLLAIENFSAHNNGTAGFWDIYFWLHTADLSLPYFVSMPCARYLRQRYFLVAVVYYCHKLSQSEATYTYMSKIYRKRMLWTWVRRNNWLLNAYDQLSGALTLGLLLSMVVCLCEKLRSWEDGGQCSRTHSLNGSFCNNYSTFSDSRLWCTVSTSYSGCRPPQWFLVSVAVFFLFSFQIWTVILTTLIRLQK